MDSKLYYLLAAVLAAICISCTCAKSVAKEMDNSIDPYERATWLDTRDEEDSFKTLLLMNLVQLSREGYIADGVVKNPENNVDKRGRWQGFCFRRTRSGRFLPYICWKGEARK